MLTRVFVTGVDELVIGVADSYIRGAFSCAGACRRLAGDAFTVFRLLQAACVCLQAHAGSLASRLVCHSKMAVPVGFKTQHGYFFDCLITEEQLQQINSGILIIVIFICHTIAICRFIWQNPCRS